MKFPYPYKALDFRDNVANSVAERFYRDHGVETIEKAMEASESPVAPGTVVMTTRHCILRELSSMCKRDNAKSRGRNSDAAFKEPLMLTSGNRRFRLKFDCRNCEDAALHRIKESSVSRNYREVTESDFDFAFF